MVRRETPSSSAAWSSETLRPIRGATGLSTLSATLSGRAIDPPGLCAGHAQWPRQKWRHRGLPANVYASRCGTVSCRNKLDKKEKARQPNPSVRNLAWGWRLCNLPSELRAKSRVTAAFARKFNWPVFWPVSQILTARSAQPYCLAALAAIVTLAVSPACRRSDTNTGAIAGQEPRRGGQLVVS